MVSQDLLEISTLSCMRPGDRRFIQPGKGLPGWFVRIVVGNTPLWKIFLLMLIDEGDKWVKTTEADLPVPPPPMD